MSPGGLSGRRDDTAGGEVEDASNSNLATEEG
jgi:hypothetical protein